MKTKLTCLLLALTLTGCSLLKPTDDAGVVRANPIVRTVAIVGATAALQKHPESRPAFLAAAAALADMEKNDAISPSAIMAVLATLPVKEFQDGDNVLYFSAGLLLLEDLTGGKQIDLAKSPALKSVVMALRQAFEIAAGQTSPPEAVPKFTPVK